MLHSSPKSPFYDWWLRNSKTREIKPPPHRKHSSYFRSPITPSSSEKAQQCYSSYTTTLHSFILVIENTALSIIACIIKYTETSVP